MTQIELIKTLTDICLALTQAVKQHDGDEVGAGDLRGVGYQLVVLAGELTKLGVDMAHSANDHARPAYPLDTETASTD